MSIVRGEIPKLLNLSEIIEKIANPPHHFSSSADFGNKVIRPSKSACVSRSLSLKANDYEYAHVESEKNFLSKKSLQQNNSPSNSRPLFSALTNDGTNSLYYPNGQLAIISATVHGFYIDNVPVNSSLIHNSTLASTNISVNQSANNSILQDISSIKATNYEKGLVQHTIKNSFTTCVFGMDNLQTKSKKDSFFVRLLLVDIW